MTITARRGHWYYLTRCGWWLVGTNIVIDRQPEGGYLTTTGWDPIERYLDSSMEWVEANLAEYISVTAGRSCGNCGAIHGDAAEAERDGSAWWHGDSAEMPEVGAT